MKLMTNRRETTITKRQSGSGDEPRVQIRSAVVGWSLDEWRQWAACKNIDTRLFFADIPVEALAMCEVCPVAVECLDFALRERMDYGVWGGMTAAQRMSFMRSNSQTLAKLLKEMDLVVDQVAIELAEKM